MPGFRGPAGYLALQGRMGSFGLYLEEEEREE